MVQGEAAQYQNQNIRFAVDFTAKRNVSLGTGSAQKEICLQKYLKKLSRIWTYIKWS